MYGELYRLYDCKCGVCLAENAKPGNSFAMGADLVDTVLQHIYNGFDVKKDIDPDLYKHTVDALNRAVDKGFGKVELGSRDEDFLHELKYNNSVFAAFKTHRQQNDLHRLLMDEDGKPKDFARFRKDTEPVIGSYNVNWLQTEHATAVKCARTAAEFLTYERESDLYPNIKWLASMAVEPRSAHKPYYDMVRSLTDTFWKTTYPGCVWGCQCSSTNTAEPITHGTEQTIKDAPKPAKGLEQNPAYSKACFSEKHPYRTNTYPGAEKAVESFVEANVKKPEAVKYVVTKQYKNGGEVLIHPEVDKSKSDYKAIYTLGNQFAKAGHKVKLTPGVHFKSEAYQQIYGSLMGTKYERKCPDLKIDDKFYEYEGYVPPFKKEKIKAMISHGLKQSSRIIINNSKGANDRFIKRSILTRINQGLAIDEVWLYEKGKVRLVYKKTGTHK